VDGSVPFPNPDTQFKPGVAPNPKGYSKKRRITDRLIKMLEDEGLDAKVAATLFAAAIGDETLLEGRKPNAQFMAMLLDRVEGKVTEKVVEERTVNIVRVERQRPGGDQAALPAPDAGDGPEPDEAVQRGELRETLGEDDPGPGPAV
jgi:hypothetical protein